MALFLLEYGVSAQSREDVRPLFDDVSRAVQGAGGEFIEAQVPTALDRAYVVVENADEGSLNQALTQAGRTPRGVSEVRLVGASLDEVKAARGTGGPDYLVEWDFPAGLTMDTYLER